MKKNCKLANVELVKEGKCYYLTPTYRIEDDSKIVEETLYKIPLPLNNFSIITREYDDSGCHVDIGYGPIYIPSSRGDILSSSKVLEEKVQELTVEEIEKRLGYKVKIVDNQKIKEVPKKSIIDVCRKCRFYHSHECANHPGCVDCPNRRSDATDSILKFVGNDCRCATVRSGQPCPYFEEWKGEK
jgi:hypothetical protein